LRFFKRFAVALLVFVLFLPNASADSPKSLYNQGKKAEARQDYITAYDFYKQAYDQQPQNLQYRVKFERMRFLAAAALVEKGLLLRNTGKFQEALDAFQKAQSIDPSSAVAQQEAQRTQELIRSQGAPPAAAAPPAKPDMLRKRIEEAEGPVELAPMQDQAVTMRLSGDSKLMYQTIGKLAGINVLFDPDYTPRQMPPLDLNGVTLQQALNMVALESNTFWRPVTPNTIFVAADTQTKRRQLEQNVIKTFYLSNFSQPSDLQDIVAALRQMLDVQKVLPNNAQGAIVIRGTPDQVALAQKMIEDFDKAKPEVVVEVAIMQVRRDKLRNLGFQPPASASIVLKPATSTTTTTTPTTTGGTTTTTTTGTSGSVGTLSLNEFKNLNANNFLVTIPAATLNFLYTDSSAKLLQNPQIRASDGIKASLKIGDRIPVATGSFQPGIGGVGINPLVNTQFQYLDVGVNIDITPRVHTNRDISLKLAMDISSQTSTVNIGGIQQPVISQRKIEHDIRLREGEVSLLGGIFEDQNTKSLAGIPGLAQIPILKYFFGSEQVEHIENEIVFVLIPHLVRDTDITESNLRAIDVGTANAIDLRRGVTKPPAGAAQPPPTPQGAPPPTQGAPSAPRSQAPPAGQPVQPVTTAESAAARPTPDAAVNPAAAAPASPSSAAASLPTQTATPGTAALKFDPARINTSTGGSFSVNIVMTGGTDIYSVPIQLTYDPKLLQLVSINNGDFLSRDGQPVALAHRDDNGTIVASATRPPGSPGVTGEGTVFTLTWQVKGPGDSVLSITRPGARNSSQQAVPVLGSQITVSAH
jgi:general secretion pathway protein D